jgi:hypothetical protein
VRIIRSKGLGVFFCSQFPDDVPGVILGQTGNRIQRALPAYAPRPEDGVRRSQAGSEDLATALERGVRQRSVPDLVATSASPTKVTASHLVPHALRALESREVNDGCRS